MTITEVITRADAQRPNVFPAEMKAEWIKGLEASFAEMMGVDDPENNYDPNDDTDDLLVPFPHDEVYVLYLCAKIDYAQEETQLYANDMAVANQAIAETQSWYRRGNRPDTTDANGVRKYYTGVYR